MKTLLCAMARNENKYLKKWAQYHLYSVGFTHIVLYDNGFDEDERPIDVLDEYVKDGTVNIIDFRDKTLCQPNVYNDCLMRYSDNYDWIAFIDIDEYFTINNNGPTNIGECLARDIFNDYDVILCSWLTFGDCDKLEYEDNFLCRRFTQYATKKITWENSLPKAMVRGRVKGFYFESPHIPNESTCSQLRICNGSGNKAVQIGEKVAIPWMGPNYGLFYIRHYVTKTISEYCEKISRGDPTKKNDCNQMVYRTKLKNVFFKLNEPTQEKIDIIKEKLGIDMSELLKKNTE